MKVVIIGGGAAGVMCALNINPLNEVILIDGNSDILKKLLLTGNGRCNYWNEHINLSCYNTNNKEILNTILTPDRIDDTFTSLLNFGIYPKIKNNYYYPYSLSSNSVKEIFKVALNSKNIKIITDFNVSDIKYENSKFNIIGPHNIEADRVVIATGSKAGIKDNKTSVYNILERLNHQIIPLKPALVPLKLKNPLKDLAGIRAEGILSLFDGDTKIKEEKGEMQFTDYGISGICTLNISSNVSKNNNLKATFNFLPEIDNVIDFLNNRNILLRSPSIENLLESLFHYKIIHTLLKISSINKEDKWSDLEHSKKNALVSLIHEFPLDIDGTLDFDRAQVVSGGVPLTEINPNTMESNIVKGLYIVGEVLDVDGVCGGFNLAFAFITGKLAGENIC